jgi:hypothetical protein
MIAALVILTALALIIWWVRYTVRTFAAIGRNLFRAAVEISYMWRVLTRPRGTLLDQFLARRRLMRR